eukprot:9830219-Karenia_brevis.AAC.1
MISETITALATYLHFLTGLLAPSQPARTNSAYLQPQPPSHSKAPFGVCELQVFGLRARVDPTMEAISRC